MSWAPGVTDVWAGAQGVTLTQQAVLLGTSARGCVSRARPGLPAGAGGQGDSAKLCSAQTLARPQLNLG